MDDFVKDFLVETAESLAALDNDLVQLEAAPDDHALISRIFRTLHTIKGTCGFLGLTRLGLVAHAGENVLGRLRSDTLTTTPETITLILRCVDAIKRIVSSMETNGNEGTGDDSVLIAELDVLFNSPGNGAAPVAEATSHEAVAFEALEDMPVSAPAPAPTPVAVVPPAAAPPRAAAEETEAPRESALANQNIRVGIDLLETLMNMVSELVLTRNQLLQLLRNVRDSEFTAPLQRLSLITSELQEGVMKTRMQPVGNAWAKLPRIVRDLARETGKKIDLAMDGADTEVDRQILELIKDPLTHMVRNSADHGLETPAERIAAGKDGTGRIDLTAYHEGGHIIIRIADNGRGLNVDRIRAKAAREGLASEAALATMADSQIFQFIFRAGFSTAATITSVSGRGVGMDVVRTNIAKIGGTIEVSSVTGKGAVFLIKIPLTLAIVSALIVGCGGERFAVPQISVVELVRASGGEHRVEMIRDTAVLRLRDRLLPLVDLRALFELGAPEAGSEQLVVVTQVGPHRFGIVVDRVFDTEEIVVKPVAPLLKSIGIYSGNTILGDGAVCMILDPNGILTRIGRADSAPMPSEAPAETVRMGMGERMRLLLVRAGSGMRKALPLDLVARLEEVAIDDIQISDGRMLVKYRDRLMPLVLAAEDVTMTPGTKKPVLVFAELDPGQQSSGERQMGLVVDAIEDIVEAAVRVEIRASRPDIVGSALVDGQPTEVVDTAYHLTRASGDWFHNPSRRAAQRVLLVDDSGFFRNLIFSLLRADGIEALIATNGDEALKMLETGPIVNLVVTDIEMPGLSGYDLARRMHATPRLAHIPIIALSGHTDAAAMARGAEAGFVRHLQKLDRDELMAAISEVLSGNTQEIAA